MSFLLNSRSSLRANNWDVSEAKANANVGGEFISLHQRDPNAAASFADTASIRGPKAMRCIKRDVQVLQDKQVAGLNSN
jgi:hypothetical protein